MPFLFGVVQAWCWSSHSESLSALSAAASCLASSSLSDEGQSPQLASTAPLLHYAYNNNNNNCIMYYQHTRSSTSLVGHSVRVQIKKKPTNWVPWPNGQRRCLRPFAYDHVTLSSRIVDMHTCTTVAISAAVACSRCSSKFFFLNETRYKLHMAE